MGLFGQSWTPPASENIYKSWPNTLRNRREKKEQDKEQNKEAAPEKREHQEKSIERNKRQQFKQSTQSNRAIPETPGTRSTIMSESSINTGRVTPSFSNLRIHAVMPRPGQPGSMLFDGTNITDFLEDWNIECEDYGLTDDQKCVRFPKYCTATIKDLVKLLPGYTATNWTTLQMNVKEMYWQHDKLKNTQEALIKLVKEAPSMDLNAYIVKFTAITDSLIAKHALSDLDRVGRLLDGLQPELRSRVLKFCAKKSWRLSAHDTGTEEPDFDELKEFVLTEAKAAQKQTVYNNERAIREGSDHLVPSIIIPPNAATTSATSAATSAPTSAPTTIKGSVTPSILTPSDPVAELTKQFSQLALLIQANMQGPKFTPATAAPMNAVPARTLRCIFCDTTEHNRRSNCPEFAEALPKGLVYINAQNRIVNASTGQEIPVMFGRSGMKKVFESPPLISIQM